MVRGRTGRPKIGIFQEGTHRVVDIPRCPIHHPLVNEAAACLRAALREAGAAPYAEAAHAGLVRALQAVVERPTGTLQVVLVCREDAPGAVSRALGESLAGRLGARLHSLWWNGNPERTNVILGPRWERWRGPEAVRERIGGVDVFFPPGAFGQSHLALSDTIVDRIHAHVPDGARVAELHAGCGAIGLGLLARSRAVVFNESSEAGLAGLALGLAARPPEERARAELAPGRAEERLALLAAADVVIVDPPRKGLAPELVDALRARRPARLVYLGCGLDSFERDVTRLRAPGGLRLVAVECFDLFPYGEHAEILGVLEA